MANLSVPASAPDPRMVLWDKWLWLRNRIATLRPQRIILLHHSEDVLAVLAAQELADAYGRRLIFVRHADTVASLGADLTGATHLAIHPVQQARLLARWPDLSVFLLPLCYNPDAPPIRLVGETPVSFGRATIRGSRRDRLQGASNTKQCDG